jgi:5-methylcytosine-specific restriction protein B
MARGEFADSVRAYVVKNYIEPARKDGLATIKVRAGDVHKALKFTARHPLVCSALTAMEFRREQNLELLRTDGPGQSSTTTFTFGL